MGEIKACGICKNMRVRIPIRHKEDFMKASFAFDLAIAFCRNGHQKKGDGSVKIFKIGSSNLSEFGHLLLPFNNGFDYYKSWKKHAIKCPDFKSMK